MTQYISRKFCVSTLGTTWPGFLFTLLQYISYNSCSVKGKVNVKWSRYRPGGAQRVGRGIALLFHDRGTRRGWVVSSTPRPHSTPGKDPVPIIQEAEWAPGPVRTAGKSRFHQDSIPDRPPLSQSLYRLSFPAQTLALYETQIYFAVFSNFWSCYALRLIEAHIYIYIQGVSRL